MRFTEYYSVELLDWTGTNGRSPGANCMEASERTRSAVGDRFESGPAAQAVEVRVAAGAGGG